MDEPTRPSQPTRDAERDEAEAPHQADRLPTPEEERLAEEHELDADVAEHEREMGERGAQVPGEGQNSLITS